jgi:hypothetical protein
VSSGIKRDEPGELGLGFARLVRPRERARQSEMRARARAVGRDQDSIIRRGAVILLQRQKRGGILGARRRDRSDREELAVAHERVVGARASREQARQLEKDLWISGMLRIPGFERGDRVGQTIVLSGEINGITQPLTF